MTDHRPAYTLRDLPMPAKLVVTCFLCAVGLGYFSAMVQLHMQHSSRKGEGLPSAADVVEVFAGWKKATADDLGPPRSKLQKLIMGPQEGPFNGTGTMAPAFYSRDAECALSDKLSKIVKENPAEKEPEEARRRGEQIALDEWLKLPEDGRKEAYQLDKLDMPEALDGKPITPNALSEDKKSVRVKHIFTERCVRCHSAAGGQANFPLETIEQIAKYWVPPDPAVVVDGMVRSDRQIGLEKLTQSTHAHLLSFAMLFSLTGLTFAFTRWWKGVRCLFAPLVVVSQVADVSCWWLARLEGVGPYFALAILATGTATAVGLLVQIAFSLIDMWWSRGGAVLLAFLAIAATVVAGLLAVKVVLPALEVERKAPAPKKPEVPAIAKGPPALTPIVQVSHLEKLIMGERKGAPWNGNGSMAPAFFEKDKKFKELVAKRPEAEGERDGERLALQAWLRTPIADRRKAYDADNFPLPPDRAGKPITADFLGEDGKAVKVKSILSARCASCHGPDGDQEDYQLHTWDGLEKYFGKPPE